MGNMSQIGGTENPGSWGHGSMGPLKHYGVKEILQNMIHLS